MHARRCHGHDDSRNVSTHLGCVFVLVQHLSGVVYEAAIFMWSRSPAPTFYRTIPIKHLNELLLGTDAFLNLIYADILGWLLSRQHFIAGVGGTGAHHLQLLN